MRTFNRWMALAMLVGGSAAYADRNDFEVTKLGNPDVGEAGFNSEANANFRAFTRTFAAALTTTNLMPPETLGHAGFSLNAELAVVGLPPISEVRLPTQDKQTDTLLVPSVHVRKGLPFSFELGARMGWVDRSKMFAATGELKWAVNEGFTWLPDVGVRLHVTRLLGNSDFDLTAAGLDVGVGKQFPLGGMVTLTPYGGMDFVGVAASTDTLDFNQGRTTGDTLGNRYVGLDDTAVYDEVRLMENVNTRFYGGVRFIGGALQLGAEVSLTSQGSFEAVRADTQEAFQRDLPAVLAFSTTLGLDF
ncbi:MAG TPA: hypothetical protein VLQ93_04020 [Myxococcaceae bacterium]|nr:hypothetical protein [Myxococcaceae bacterium]